MGEIFFFLLYVVIAVGFLVGIWHIHKARAKDAREAARHAASLDAIPPEAPRSPEDEPFFRITLAVLVVLGFAFILIPDARAGDAQKPRPILLNLNDCPPQGNNGLPIVAFIISLSADGKSFQSTCARISKRNYKPAARRKPAVPVSSKE